jgi:hypothetical protein
MKAGRIFVALLLLTGIMGALITGADIYSRFLYLSVLLVFGSWGWTFWVARGLRLSRSARILRANVGDFFEEHFEVVNGSRVLAPWIEVFNQSAIPYALAVKSGHILRAPGLPGVALLYLVPRVSPLVTHLACFVQAKRLLLRKLSLSFRCFLKLNPLYFLPAFCQADRSFVENHLILRRTRQECVNMYMVMR